MPHIRAICRIASAEFAVSSLMVVPVSARKAPSSESVFVRSFSSAGEPVATFQGLLIFAVSLIAGFRPASLFALPLALAVLILTAVVFAALGTAIGSTLKDMQGFQLVMNFMVMPIFFLSGALYPLANLPKALAVLTRVDPLTYGVDGVRGALTGVTHFGIGFDALALAGVAVLLLGVGAWRFSKIEI